MGFEIAIIIFALWIVQGILSYFQIKNFNGKLAKFKNYHKYGIGQVKGWLGKGAIAILGIDSCNNIVDAEIMSGISVFARFRSLDLLKGKNIQEIDSILNGIGKPVKTAILKATESVQQVKRPEKEVESSM